MDRDAIDCFEPPRVIRSAIREEAPRLLLISIAVGLAFILYNRLGSPVDPSGEKSTLLWIWTRWRTSGQTTEYLYARLGLLIPLTSLVLVWMKRGKLRLVPASVSWVGMMCVVLALVMHWVGVKGEHPRFSALSLVVLLFGAIWFLRGGAVARTLLFPVGFLFFIVPLNFLNGLTLKLRVVIAKMAAAILSGLGVDCQSRGAAILGSSDDPFLLTLQANSYALRDVLVLAMVGSVVAYLCQRSPGRRVVMFALLGFLYLFCLISVFVMLGLLTQVFGPGVRELFGDGVISGLVFALVALIAWWLAPVVRGVDWTLGLRAGRACDEAA